MSKRIINSMIVILLLVSIIMILVSVYNQSNEDRLLHDMKVTCERSHAVIDGSLEKSCGQLIDRVQAQGFEVLSNDSGEFWAEYNPTANKSD